MLPVAVTTPPVVKFPPDTFPVAFTTPPVLTLPTLILPVVVIVLLPNNAKNELTLLLLYDPAKLIGSPFA